jgi:hypothetical protein
LVIAGDQACSGRRRTLPQSPARLSIAKGSNSSTENHHNIYDKKVQSKNISALIKKSTENKVLASFPLVELGRA